MYLKLINIYVAYFEVISMVKWMSPVFFFFLTAVSLYVKLVAAI